MSIILVILVLVTLSVPADAQTRMPGIGAAGGRGPIGGGPYGGGRGGGGPIIGLGSIGALPGLLRPPRPEVQDVDDDEPLMRRPTRNPDFDDAPPPYRPRPRRPPPVLRVTPEPAPDIRQAREPRLREDLPRTAQRPKPSRAVSTSQTRSVPQKAVAKKSSPPTRPPAATAPLSPRGAAQMAAVASDEVPGEVLFTLRTDADGASLRAILRRERLELISTDSFTLVPMPLHRARIRDRRSVSDVVAALSRDGRVASAQANHIFSLAAGPAPAPALSGAQYAVAKLKLAEAHVSSTGRNVVVAVIDSGVDEAHPALQGAVSDRFDAVGDASKAHSHGTAVASIVGARSQLLGAAPEARLLPVRAFSAETRAGAQGTTVHILRGLDWAGKQNARVVNMSFAGPSDAKLSEFLAAGTGRGAIYVAAAGNAGPNSPPLFPAADPNVIAVTATDAQDRVFSAANRGPYICVAAPGVDILVAAPNGSYGLSSGTSMAAAQVSGIVALMLQEKPGLSPKEVREALTGSARDLGAPGPDGEYGAGFADADGAVRALSTPLAGVGSGSRSAGGENATSVVTSTISKP
ncbi:MAG: S8 family serine peptidase [Methylobacterium sp.]|uniref:S8 family peptidase n=1 Tax=Methylobacterium sp. TaxID=409 RepID=UPI0025FBA5D7|nr:S8 family serine peptidase [Methylobacterium sp.]MBX9932812.1 S8 family serine peptidase [Methylobacterium sp.]